VFEAEDFDASITASGDNYMLVFGDFSQYVIADRVGMTVEFIPHLVQHSSGYDSASRPTGQRGWYAHYRVGAGVTLPAAFRMLNV
jgi:HK97 family phage major capsid protein